MNLRATRSSICLSLVFFLSCIGAANAANERGKMVFQLCESCHGPDAHGLTLVNAPAIAGLPAWYIKTQLQNFADGARGGHPADEAGLRMRPMARSLRGDDADAVAEYVASMKPAEPSPTVGGSAEKGKPLYMVCAACHGANGEGNVATHAPPLKYSNDWYLVHQLMNFKNHLRAYDAAKDPNGATMTPMATTLPDEQAMKDVITFVQSQK